MEETRQWLALTGGGLHKAERRQNPQSVDHVFPDSLSVRSATAFHLLISVLLINRPELTEECFHLLCLMAELLVVVGILANVAAVSNAGIQISQSLYEISKRLINAPKEIAEVALEVAHLSEMVKILGDVLKSAEKLVKPELLQNAKEILTRFENIQKDIKDIVQRGARGFHRLKLAFGWTTLSQLVGKLNALKSSLSLVINVLQLSIVAKRVKK